MSAHLNRLREARKGVWAEAKVILDAATREARELTSTEARDYDRLMADIDERDAAIRELDAVEAREADIARALSQLPPAADPPGSFRRDSSATFEDGAPLAPEQRMADFVVQRGLAPRDQKDLSLRKYLRGLVTGDWHDADAERRAMAEGTSASGGFMVPTILSAEIIDLARNQARVMQAGARVVPMPNKTLDIAKWVGDPTAAWRNEAGTITPSDGTLGTVQLLAKSLASLTIASRELLEDAPNVEDELRQAFAAQFALTVDRAALYGTGTAPEPRGIKNTTGVTTTSLGANGSALTYDHLVDAAGVLADANELAGGVIYAPRTARGLAKSKDTANKYLEAPEYIAGLPRYESTQVPTNLVQGVATTASDVFVGDWNQLLIGVRTGLQVQVLTERYADTGQVGFVCHWRGDIAVARPKAFNVLVGAL